MKGKENEKEREKSEGRRENIPKFNFCTDKNDWYIPKIVCDLRPKNIFQIIQRGRIRHRIKKHKDVGL
jgi:hypothetical protein